MFQYPPIAAQPSPPAQAPPKRVVPKELEENVQRTIYVSYIDVSVRWGELLDLCQLHHRVGEMCVGHSSACFSCLSKAEWYKSVNVATHPVAVAHQLLSSTSG